MQRRRQESLKQQTLAGSAFFRIEPSRPPAEGALRVTRWFALADRGNVGLRN
jgi:hypothetical protein